MALGREPTGRHWQGGVEAKMIVQLKKAIPAGCVPRRLSANRQYLVLGISADAFRLLDDEDDPVLHEPDLFDVIDGTEPNDWVFEYGEDGERYEHAAELPRYAWEDYHDRVEEAVQAVQAYLRRVGPCSWPVKASGP